MRSYEIITSEVTRLGSRLQPKRHGAVLIRRVSVGFVGDPPVVVAKVNRFSFVGRSFEQIVHGFATRLKSLRKHTTFWSAELVPVLLGGEPPNPAGCAFAADATNANDEFTKRRDLFRQSAVMGGNVNPATVCALWGVHPMCIFHESGPGTVVRLEASKERSVRRWLYPASQRHCSSQRLKPSDCELPLSVLCGTP